MNEQITWPALICCISGIVLFVCASFVLDNSKRLECSLRAFTGISFGALGASAMYAGFYSPDWPIAAFFVFLASVISAIVAAGRDVLGRHRISNVPSESIGRITREGKSPCSAD